MSAVASRRPVRGRERRGYVTVAPLESGGQASGPSGRQTGSVYVCVFPLFLAARRTRNGPHASVVDLITRLQQLPPAQWLSCVVLRCAAPANPLSPSAARASGQKEGRLSPLPRSLPKRIAESNCGSLSPRCDASWKPRRVHATVLFGVHKELPSLVGQSSHTRPGCYLRQRHAGPPRSGR